MPEDDSLESNAAKIISAVSSIDGPKGVMQSNVDTSKREDTKEKSQEKVKPNLTPDEVGRITNIAKVVGKIILPKEEAKVLKRAEKLKLPVKSPAEAMQKRAVGGLVSNALRTILGPGMLLLGGLAALVAGLNTDGPFKGLLKILTKIGLQGFISKLTKSISSITKTVTSLGDFLSEKLLKPFIGLKERLLKPFVGLKEKILKPFTGLGEAILKPFTGLGETILKPFTGLGEAMLKPFTGVKDFIFDTFKGLKEKIISPVVGVFGRGGGIGKIFSGILPGLARILTPVVKRIPGIGSLISWGFAVSRFKSGDIVGGLIDVASGIATLFPGIGTGIGIGLDVLNAFIDFKTKGGAQEEVKPAGSGFSIGDFFGKIKDKILNNFPIKNLVEFWSGAGMVMTGNFKGGFTKMAYAIPFMKPLSDWLFGTPDIDTGERGGGVTATVGDFLIKVKDKIMSSFPVKNLVDYWSGISAVMSGNFKEGFSKMASAIPFMKPLGDWLFGTQNMDTGERNNNAGVLSNVGNFLSSVKDTLLKKVLNFLPEKVLGFSVRARVGQMLGIDMGPVMDDETKESNEREDKRVAAFKAGEAKAWSGVEKPKAVGAVIKEAYKDRQDEPLLKQLSIAKERAEQARVEDYEYNKMLAREWWISDEQAKTRDELAEKLNKARVDVEKIRAELVKKSEAQPTGNDAPPMQAGSAPMEVGQQVNDFVRDKESGKVHPINSQDEIMGLKTGGAIESFFKERLLKGGNLEVKALSEKLINLGIEQTKLLQEIALNTKNGNVVVQNNQRSPFIQQNKPEADIFNLNTRSGFIGNYKNI